MAVARQAVARRAAGRSLAGALALVTVAAALAGCTGSTPEPSPEPSPTASTAPSPTEPLQVAAFGDALRLRTYRDIVEEFRQQSPDTPVRLTTYPDAAAALDPTLTALEQGWAPDVFLADYRDLAQLVGTGGLEPVDTMLEDREVDFGDGYQRLGLTSFSANARLQCMPAEVSPLVVYYNKRLFRRSQPGDPVELPTPEDVTWDWEEFVAVARATAGLDQLGPVKGAWFPADVETLAAFLRSAGGDVVDDEAQPTSLTLASDDGVRVVEALATLARDPSVSLTAAQLEQRSPVAWFADGKLGMYVGTRADLPRLRATRGLRFDVLPLPSFGRTRSVSTMNAWCVNAGTDQLAKAGDFVAFAVGPEASRIAARSGAIVPSSLEVLHDRSFVQPRQQPRHADIYAAAIRRSDPMPFSPAWRTVAAQVDAALARLYTDPSLDLEATLQARLERLDERSVALFTPAEEP